MNNEVEIIRQTGTRLICRIDDCSMITGKFIKSFSWPNGADNMIVLFRNQIEDEHEILSSIPLEFDVGMFYSSSKESLPTGLVTLTNGIIQVKMKDVNRMAGLYEDCRRRIFAGTPVTFTDPADREKIIVKMKNQLQTARIGYWEQGAASAGIIIVTETHDYNDNPVDWIPWIWIAEDITQDVRDLLHVCMRLWLGGIAKNTIKCVVNSFNIRSQKFFRKIGFIPECIRILKP